MSLVYRPSLRLLAESPPSVSATIVQSQHMASYLYFIARRAYEHGVLGDALYFQREAAGWSHYVRQIQGFEE